MNAYELADQVEMWGEDLLALNMKGGIPVVQGAKMLRHQADYIAQLEKGLESSIAMNKAQAERQVKELTDEDRSMLIRTLKWAEDLLREAGHDEMKRSTMFRIA
jgi:hypothetical protein